MARRLETQDYPSLESDDAGFFYVHFYGWLMLLTVCSLTCCLEGTSYMITDQNSP